MNETTYGGYVRLTEDNLQPVELQPVEGFSIDNDEKAEWALGKIREAREERDRLLELVTVQQEKLNEQRQQIERRYSNDTDYLRYLLSRYMDTVKVKETKTQESYRLLSGSLVRKKASMSMKVTSDDALAMWLMENGREDLVKVSPRWGDVKSLLSVAPDTGVVTLAETGELVDGVEAVQNPEKFDIKFN